VISEIRSRVEPEIQNLAESFGPEVDWAAFIDETDQRNLFVMKRFEQTLGHGLNAGESPRTAIAAAREIVDSDRHLATGARRNDGANQEKCKDAHILE